MLLFLKLGGSLITDKRQPEQPRYEVLARLAQEIAAARQANPALQLLIGHGSGSFGHLHAKKYGTRAGVQTPAAWQGFARTGDAAARLNRIVIAALLAADLPAWSIQPSAMLHCVDGHIVPAPAHPVAQALTNQLIPVIYGDVALDAVRGGTIVSTEEIFQWLAPLLRPARLLLAGEVDGIYTADPLVEPTAQRIPSVTPRSLVSLQGALGGSHGVDVTGGMATKVAESLDMIGQLPGLTVTICSGLIPGNVQQALTDPQARVGTVLLAG